VHTYTQYSKPEQYGINADGFVTKGVLHARIATTSDKAIERSIDLFVTHMEAREPKIRPSQYAEFAEFVQQHSSPDRPALLMGDFNTLGNSAQLEDSQSAYHLMTGKFRDARPESQFSDLWTSFGKGHGGTSDQLREEGGKRIDYIFLLNPQTQAAPKIETQKVAVNRFLDPKVIALSDHSAVEATLQLKQ
jgi:endonuclease/exonuclease/phosphatase family metal-dependent hydrolase